MTARLSFFVATGITARGGKKTIASTGSPRMTSSGFR